MKATIDKIGVLTVKAETELESYAMRMWAKENINNTSNHCEVANFIVSYESSPTQKDKRELLSKGYDSPQLNFTLKGKNKDKNENNRSKA